MCLGVTCHLHCWQNDREILRATAVTRGWSRHQIKSQHTKLTLEKKILLPGFELTTFQSRVRRSYQQAILAPQYYNNDIPALNIIIIMIFIQPYQNRTFFLFHTKNNNNKNNKNWNGERMQWYMLQNTEGEKTSTTKNWGNHKKTKKKF